MQPYELPEEQYALYQNVRQRLGEVAATSLACVFLDGAQRFIGISQGEEALIRQIARFRKVSLPV